MPDILVENIIHRSHFLNRDVQVDCYLPKQHSDTPGLRLLLINDGQNLEELDLVSILTKLYEENKLQPLLCVGVGAGAERKHEYGVSSQPDYLGRGAKASQYTAFVMRELLPCLFMKYPNLKGSQFGFAGFSLGGLMALDIVWNYPEHFSTAGVFSGSLWWRSLDDKDDDYQDEQHRIMHQLIKNGRYQKDLKFFFTTGSFDETHDRNKNGIIDSIDDTRSLIEELELLGYKNGEDIRYVNYSDGRHDVSTWARSMPYYLEWGWGIK